MKTWILFTAFVFHFMSQAQSPLAPVATESPRQTYTSFMEAMNDYREGVLTKNTQKQLRIWDAVRTLNLEGLPTLTKNEQGKRAAIYLKEALDRVVVLKSEEIPETVETNRWRVPETQITLIKMESGEHTGEFLFSSQTVQRAEEFYEKVKSLPYLKGSGQGAIYKPSWESERLPSWVQGTTLGFRHWQIIGLFLGLLLGFLAKGISQFLIRSLTKWVTGIGPSSLKQQFLSALERPLSLGIAGLIWLVAFYSLRFEGATLNFLVGLSQIVLGIAVVWAIYKLVDVFALWLESRMDHAASLNTHLLPFIKKSLRVFVVLFGALLILQNLGFNVMSVLAGLGLGGLAFALAAKDTAANLFGSIMILIDRPFRVGDFINVGGAEGTVEEIGFRSTRIRTLYDSLISIPNSSIVITNIDNYGAREVRRTRTILGITYDTPPEKIEAFIQGIQNIILANPNTFKDLYQVVFEGFGDSSLNILVNFFIRAEDVSHELDIRQNIFIEILRLAKKMEIDFAFPTTTLHMETFPEKRPSVIRHEKWDREQIAQTAQSFAKGGAESQPRGLGLYRRPPFVKQD